MQGFIFEKERFFFVFCLCLWFFFLKREKKKKKKKKSIFVELLSCVCFYIPNFLLRSVNCFCFCFKCKNKHKKKTNKKLRSVFLNIQMNGKLKKSFSFNSVS